MRAHTRIHLQPYTTLTTLPKWSTISRLAWQPYMKLTTEWNGAV